MAHFDIHSYNSALLFIDMQERFVPAIPSIDPENPQCGKQCALLMQAAEILEVPCIISEQYPKGLGETLPAYQAITHQTRLPKMHFSCCDEETLRECLADSQRDNIIICGIEAHVCVLSTCADLIQRGYNAIVAGDAIDSRNPDHAEMARTAMRDLGALVLPCEAIVMRLQRLAGTDSFKALSKLIR